MGFIKKAMKKVTADELKSTDGGPFVGLDAGDYEARIIDVKIGEYGPNTANKGRPRLELEIGILRDWDGNEVRPEQKVRTMIGLFSHWNNPQKSLNFTLFQFLKSLEGGWDYEEDEPGVEFEDEADAQETLMGLNLNVSLGYRTTEPTDKYPTPAVFPDLTRFLRPDADLGPNLKLGGYEEYREKVVAKHKGTQVINPARDEVKGDTDVDFRL